MKKIGFIGAFDKVDFILYIGKLLSTLGNRVLIIDADITQRARYIVPAMTNAESYITQFENMEIAVGFNSFNTLYNYLGMLKGQELNYDIVLIDIDSPETFKSFDMQNAEQNYFVTAFDMYSLKKGIEVLSALEQPIEMTKILFTRKVSREENQYLDQISSQYQVKWQNDIIYFPLEQGDQTEIAENQRVAKIKYRNLSANYKNGIMLVGMQIAPNGDIKRAMKQIEKGF